MVLGSWLFLVVVVVSVVVVVVAATARGIYIAKDSSFACQACEPGPRDLCVAGPAALTEEAVAAAATKCCVGPEGRQSAGRTATVFLSSSSSSSEAFPAACDFDFS